MKKEMQLLNVLLNSIELNSNKLRNIKKKNSLKKYKYPGEKKFYCHP